MHSHFLTSATVAILLSLSSLVNAGPGANVFACLSTEHASPPFTFPLDITFSPAPPECMGRNGHSSTVTATEPGLTCTEVGYVEAKRSGMCFMDTSIWQLTYKTSNGTDGMVITKWSKESRHGPGKGKMTMNTMDFLQARGTVVACAREDGCKVTDRGRVGYVWDVGTQGPVYVVFET